MMENRQINILRHTDTPRLNHGQGRELIIGASSAGLYTGLRLAQKGIPVRIIEQRDRRDPDHRVLIVTPEILRFINLPDEVVLNRIRRYELNSPNQRATIELSRPDIVFDRKDFLIHLQRRAEAAGVEIVRARGFKGIFKDGNDWYAECSLNSSDKREYYGFTKIIGADGANSVIARCFDKELEKVHLIQARVELRDCDRADTVRIWFDRDYTDYFVWLIPEGNGEAACGLISNNQAEAKVKLDEFLDAHSLLPIAYEHGVTTCYSPGFLPECSLDGAHAYLVGDAGCQVKMTTVGGTFAGFWGGNAVAEAIIHRIDLKRTMRSLKQELDIHHYFRSILKRLSNSDFDLLLKMSDRGFKKLLERFSRDQAGSILRRIIVANPLVSLLGYRHLIRSLRKNLGLL